MSRPDKQDKLSKHYDEAAVRAAVIRARVHVESDRDWCEKADVKEATLRKFTSGASHWMGIDKFIGLARATGLSVSELIGEVEPSGNQEISEETVRLLREARAALTQHSGSVDVLLARISAALEGKTR